MTGEFLASMVQAMLPQAMAQLQQRDPDEIAAVAEKAVRDYVPAVADRARLVRIVRALVARLEATP